MKSALDIAKNALQSLKVRLPRIMHMKIDLLNGTGDIWLCEGQILNCTSKTPKLRRISNWSTIGGSNLRIRIHRSQTRFAIRHVSLIQDVNHVLLLGKEQTITAVLNLHIKEVVQLTKILHGELALKSRDNLIK